MINKIITTGIIQYKNFHTRGQNWMANIINGYYNNLKIDYVINV